MAKITRIATTITARYFPGQGASDAFYLDGRLTGKREGRAADITLDREDRGAFLSVFAHQAAAGKDPQAEVAGLRPLLDKILNDVKRTGKNIDAEINELADCGISVAGRMTLQHAGVRQPYFAGIVVKDQEIAAITIGRGCAYLYRNDVLYPLTDDDFEMEEIDASGRPVDGLDMYCAGVAGTVRYSNIAQLQMDDCLVVCNREVMEALGQREVLRILYEAEDQCDAAGMVITEAAAKSPGASLQFMIGFVESATVADKASRGFGIGRSKGAGASASAPSALSSLPVAPADLSDVPVLFDSSRREPVEPAAHTEEIPDAATPVYTEPVPFNYQEPEDGGGPAGDVPPVLDIPDITDTHSAPPPVRSHPAPPVRARHENVYPGHDEPEDGYDDEKPYGRSRLGVYLLIAVVAVAVIAGIWMILRKPGGATPTTAPSTKPPTTASSTVATTAPTTAGTTIPGQTTLPGGTTLPGATTTPPAGTIDPNLSKELPTTYTVKSGDTLYRIANFFYGGDNLDYCIQLIRDANGMASDSPLLVDQTLMIPAVPVETTATTTKQP